MRQPPKDQRANGGFTLVEVIISIAVLAIGSVFILQMFVASAQLNADARNVDEANTLSTTLMESFRMGEDPRALQQMENLPHAQVTQEADGAQIINHFDKDWHSLPSQEGAVFTLSAQITLGEQGEAVATSLAADAQGGLRSALYHMQVEVRRRATDKRGEAVLTSNATANLFHNEEVVP